MYKQWKVRYRFLIVFWGSTMCTNDTTSKDPHITSETLVSWGTGVRVT